MNLSDAIASIQIDSQWLGWAQRYEQKGRYLWKLHEPMSLWMQIRKAIDSTDGTQAAKPISQGAKSQPESERYRWLLNNLSDNALLALKEQMATLRAEQPLPSLLPDLSPPEPEPLDAEVIAEFVLLLNSDETELAIELLSELPTAQQQQVMDAAQTEKRTQPIQEPQEQALPPQVVSEVIQPKAEPLNEPPERIECSVVNLNLEPQWLHHRAEGMVYAGRYNKRLQLKQSPLHNPLKLKKESDRPQVLTQHIEQVVIPELERGHGPRWDEWQRLANRVRKGHPVALGCFCAPKGCHCDAHAVVVNGLAGGQAAEEIIQAVQASLPAKQANLLEVTT